MAPDSSPYVVIDGRVVSVNVGTPRDITYDVHTVRTGIFKRPIEGRAMIRAMNIDGDAQADTRIMKDGQQVHGGADKAVYVYAAEHYAYWQAELGESLPFGQFGENLTITGVMDDVVRIGDVFRIGEALLAVTAPRGPCYKLDIRMKRPEFKQLFLASGRVGFYMRVVEEGEAGAGDRVERIDSDSAQPSVREVAWRSLPTARD